MAARLKGLVLHGSVMLGAIGLSLLAVEVGLRLLAPQPTGLSHQDPYGLALHWPGITRFLPQYGTTVTFNSQGMRDTEHAVPKPPGVFRILLLGDSFMEALQVPFDSSYAALLGLGLASKTGRHVEVVNAAVSGWGTADELRYLTKYGLRYDPDLVIVALTLHNDISDNLREDWYTVHGDSLQAQPRAPASFVDYKVTQLKAYLATRSQLYQLWRKVRHGREIVTTGRQLNTHIVQLFRQPPTQRITRGYRLTALVLERLRNVVEASGGRLVVVLLPLRVQLTSEQFAVFVTAAGASLNDMPLFRPQQVMDSVGRALEIPVVDLLPPFRSWLAAGAPDPYLEWDGHWNTLGHRIAADATVREFGEMSIPPYPAVEVP